MKNSVIISGLLLISLLIMALVESSLSFAQQPPISFANQTSKSTQSSNILYKGYSLVGIRVYDIYKSGQWQIVQDYIFQGFEIKSVIPASQLPNSGSPMGVLVIMQKR